MNTCEHKYHIIERLLGITVKSDDVVRIAFFCEKCLDIAEKEIDSSKWEWKEEYE